MVIKRFIKAQLNLDKEEHESETLAEIKKSAHFSGYNLWILGYDYCMHWFKIQTV